MLIVLVFALVAAPSEAQEVFSWFSRGLLPVEFEQGDWVSYAVEEIDEYGVVTDTLTVTVIEVDTASVWLRLQTMNSLDHVAIDPRLIEPGRDQLDAILRVVHTTADGLVEEDVAALRESALVQRHFSDPFREPDLRRSALPDTLVRGMMLGRERVDLAEVRREPAGTFTIVTKLAAVAELSPDVPLLGLLRSWTLSEVTTESAQDGSRSRRRPPLINENSLACVGFGRDAESKLPEGLVEPD